MLKCKNWANFLHQRLQKKRRSPKGAPGPSEATEQQGGGGELEEKKEEEATHSEQQDQGLMDNNSLEINEEASAPPPEEEEMDVGDYSAWCREQLPAYPVCVYEC